MASTSAGYIGIVNDKPTDIITGRVYGACSGGWWMIPGSIAGATSVSLSGGVVTFDNNVINVTPGGSGTTRPLGMALMNCGSGTKNFVAMIRKGDLVVPANGNATTATNAAATYATAGEGCAANALTGSVNTGLDVIGMFIGQSCTSGANAFNLLHLNL
jgi:hypothetical protein